MLSFVDVGYNPKLGWAAESRYYGTCCFQRALVVVSLYKNPLGMPRKTLAKEEMMGKRSAIW